MRPIHRTAPILLALFTGGATLAADYEPPRTFQPAEVLPAAKVQGEHFKVAAPVENDGFMNTFHLDSDYGRFDAEGRVLLEARIREMGALAQLAELSKSKVFIDAVGQGLKGATMGQVETVQKIAENPVDTVKGIPGGVTRLFNRTKAQAGEAVSSVKKSQAGSGTDEATTSQSKELEDKAVAAGTEYAKKYLGTSKSERLWAQKLGVDPYTSNAQLKAQIASVAKVDAVGRFSVRFAGIPSIPGISYVRKANDLVWTTDPYDLKMMNEKKLAELGASPEAIAAFMSNRFLSPTRQTYVAQAIDALAGVADRGKLVAQGAVVDSETAGNFFAVGLQMLVWRHTHGSPLVRILNGIAAPVALTADGTVVGMAATDYLTWNEPLHAALKRLRSGTADVAKSYELGFLGQVSPRALAEMKALGFRVTQNLEQQFSGLGPAAPAAK